MVHTCIHSHASVSPEAHREETNFPTPHFVLWFFVTLADTSFQSTIHCLTATLTPSFYLPVFTSNILPLTPKPVYIDPSLFSLLLTHQSLPPQTFFQSPLFYLRP